MLAVTIIQNLIWLCSLCQPPNVAVFSCLSHQSRVMVSSVHGLYCNYFVSLWPVDVTSAAVLSGTRSSCFTQSSSTVLALSAYL